jgi:MFS transporter, DHA3 family, macrolide efflux protein
VNIPGAPLMPNAIPSTGLTLSARWFLAGTFASNIGNGIHTLAAGALLYQQTGTVAAFGIVVVIEQIVTVLMQLIAGPWVDRGDPRRIAVMAEVARGGIVCALALALATTVSPAMPWVLAMTVMIRVIHTFHRAGTFALTPDLVPAGDLARLNSWFSAAQQGGQLIGLAVTGVIVARWGTPAAFFINGLTFLVSGLSLAAITLPRRPTATRVATSPWWNVLKGWGAFVGQIRQDVWLLGFIVVSTADNVALITFNLLLAPLVSERIAASPYWLSIIASGFAGGAMLASALVVPVGRRFGQHQAVLLGIGGQALCFIGLWSVEPPVAMLALAVLLGIFNTISWTTAVTALQLNAPADMRGRLAVARAALTAVIMVPVVPLVALLGRHYSNAASLLVGALLCVLFMLVAIAARVSSPSANDQGTL